MARTVRWRGIDTDPESAACWEAAATDPALDDILVRPIPGFGSYKGNAASAGTDSGGGHVDINLEGLTDDQCRRVETMYRRYGNAAWERPRINPQTKKPYGWQRHLHVLRIDCADLSGPARTQIADYLAGWSGLPIGGRVLRDSGSRAHTGARWAAIKKTAKPKPAPAPKPAPSVTGDLTVANIEDAKQLWRADIIPAPGRPTTGNTHWQPDSYLRLTYETVARIEANSKALTAAVSALSETRGLDPATVQATIDAAVKDALQGLSITLTADPGGLTMRAELYRDQTGRWRWRVIARNGNILADSGQGYSRRIDCVHGLRRVTGPDLPMRDLTHARA